MEGVGVVVVLVLLVHSSPLYVVTVEAPPEVPWGKTHPVLTPVAGLKIGLGELHKTSMKQWLQL